MEENNIIKKTITENITNQNTVFIFPTQNAADLWADYITSNGPVKAVAMERFIAWDNFKGTSIRSQNQNKKSVPSTMRKIFADRLISENAENPFFKNLITPEYAASASGFTSWIASLLPGLAVWKKQFELKNLTPDEEDADLLELYKRYSAFLDSHSLFDPAWETPPFKKDGNTYILFFPEILSDWFEYKTILETTPDIKIIHLDKKEYIEAPVKMFSNSRIELTYAALQIRKLHEEQNIPWTDIALSIPDMENYGPYIDRELTLCEIPHVMRMAAPLTANPTGAFFNLAQECVTSNFSYESVKNLLLNQQLPWIENLPINRFISYGQNNHCLCSYEYKNEKIDIWKKSLAKNYDMEVETFYNDFSSLLKKMVNSSSFSQIRDNYFAFRNSFFDMDLCPEKCDRIISRCISELGALIDLETEFSECNLKNPYSFFVSCLSEANYLEQSKTNGVTVLPYKTAAASPFSYHVIIDSSQKSLSVIYKELSFLRDDKRKQLFGTDYEDNNASQEFIQLYCMNSLKGLPIFTCSAKTFTDYAQSSSYLIPENLTKCTDENILNAGDTYNAEKNWLLNNAAVPEKFSSIQKNGADFWINCQSKKDQTIPQETVRLIENTINEKRMSGGKINISATVLNQFFQCPRKWLFNSIAKLREETTEAELMRSTELGDLYHKVFELYCNFLKSKDMAIIVEDEKLPEENKKILKQAVTTAIKEAQKSFLTTELLSTTEKALSDLMNTSITGFSRTFNGCKIIATEKNYSYTDEKTGILFEGRIDCLLLDPDAEEYILVDFKSRSIPKNIYLTEDDSNLLPLEEQELPDFQMPFYIYLLRNQTPAVKIENCCFFNVTKAEAVPVTGISIYNRIYKKTKISPEDFEPVINKMIECSEYYAQHIADRNFSVNDNAQDFSTCSSCYYKAICRRTFTVSRKN